LKKFFKKTDMSNKVITLHYNLFKDNEAGEAIESSNGKNPLTFLSGVGQMIPDFENNVVNLKVGESFSFGIAALDAYGERTDEAIIDLDQEMFKKDGVLMEEIAVGNMIPLQDQEGRMVPALVLAINEETVTMDVNHPLAGQDLHFTGEIVEIREATDEEISHGHVHGPGGHQH
jgi:FKBP-type peptidyl-prolyl cis-trans isomerase SlyD